MFKPSNFAITLAASLTISTAALAETDLDIKFAGALEFAEDGTLFVGDNYNGAIYAFEMPVTGGPGKIMANSVANIDAKIAELLGVGINAIEINDMAAHPVSQDLYISVTRIGSSASQPALIQITQDQQINLVDLTSFTFQKQVLTEFPEGETTFGIRGVGPGGPLPRDIAKGEIPLRTLAIMDMEFYDGALFVAGVAHDNFLSSLRRISYPFDGTQNIANVEMYHITHDQYESRAPIRSMSVQEIDGKPQLIAAYTCSPIVLVPLEDIKDGAKITANTIMDYGNGQPLDMIPFEMGGQTMLFVTNDSRSPQVIPVAGLQGAKVVDHNDFERGGKLELHPVMPYGPIGQAVMFDGISLHMTLVGDNFLASITRDGYTGSLNLDTNPTFFPNRIHNMRAEFDFPQYEPDPTRVQ
ncbi:MAG: hypothetical protein ACI909_003705 [Planctomycetota bacterium]|jgi:hypothetical protein